MMWMKSITTWICRILKDKGKDPVKKPPLKIWISAIVAAGAVYGGAVFVQHQFQPKNITLNQQVEGIFDAPPFLDIMKHPFFYLDRGRQSFAFVSADGKYVLKFFDTRCLRDDLIPDPWTVPRKRCEKKMALLVAGYKLAFGKDRDNTGLVYVQLGANLALMGTYVTLRDRFGIEHRVDLSTVPFVLQYKAVPTREVISELLSKGDLQGAQERLRQIRVLYMDEYARGIYDRDHNFMYNTGFIGDRAIRIDVGRLRDAPNMVDAANHDKDFQIIARRLDEWLGRHYPKYRGVLLFPGKSMDD